MGEQPPCVCHLARDMVYSQGIAPRTILCGGKEESTMVRVLFVCLGNICRSPMAEFICKAMLAERGETGEYFVASAGVSDEEAGNPVYPPAKAELARHGISCEGKRARQLRPSDYEKYDYILCMEGYHVRAAARVCGGDPQGKIVRLSDFTARPHDIADPWYTRDFSTAYAEIEEGVRAFLDRA